MKIIISEAQFERFKKGMTCPFKVVFEYTTKVTLNRGRRTVCVDEDFYNRLIEDINKKYEDYSHKFNDTLISDIKGYFYETYYMDESRVKIDFIRGGDIPTIGIKYDANRSERDIDERSRSFAFTRKKRKFSEPEIRYSPSRYRKYDRDLNEVGVYDFKDFVKNNDDPNAYGDILKTGTFLKRDGPYAFYYGVKDEFNKPIVTFYILDLVEKEYVGDVIFEVRYGGEYYIQMPYIKPKYRGNNIAKEIYKIALTNGNVVSGASQSKNAVKLWISILKKLPNKMVYVDTSGNEFGVYEKNGELYTIDGDKKVHEPKADGSYLKLYKS
jgi:GNAT superfamily N-acetyltransferase